ncbi:insulin receptor substrate 1-like [Sciurus carolinensis]|uniref:insulin receptor substrate 1-like n=1 Tax=Sciurus carolinensis TaxID=30640 RepID=UPI001FB35FCB|nr:insulin receptor substrate 1-like [Sciurus carolinensis]
MKLAGGGPTTTQELEAADLPLCPPLPWPCPADVRLCGHLRKQKSQRRRFFVLREDPPRLEYYESEKKFRAGCSGGARPRRSVSLAGACTISKRADARQRHLIVLYTRDSSLGVAAASEAEQQVWYGAMLEVRAAAAAAAAADPSSHEDPGAWILAPFQDVWPVTLRPKGLGRTRGLGSGDYRLCLGSGALSLLRKPGGRGSRDIQALPPPALRLSLLSVRRCGHADSYFFLELGRSAPTGPGELWLQAPDEVVAQSIHETVLAAMKRLGGSGAGGRAEPLSRDSSTSTSRPPVPQSYESPASAAQPRGLVERMEQATLKTLARLGVAASYPEGSDPGAGYITMGVRSDYEHMGVSEADGYVIMGPSALSLAVSTTPHQPLQDWGGTEYVPMKSFPPGPFSDKSKAQKPGSGQGSTRDGWGHASDPPCSLPPSKLAGEYVYIKYGAPDLVETGIARLAPRDSCLNYVDLDLVPLEARGHGPRAGPHSYARIEF